MDTRNEKLGYKLRESLLKKIPMNFIIGDKEVDSETISYRNFGDKNMYVEPKENVIELVKKKSVNPANYFKNN